MALGCSRKPDETWRQACERYAAKYGLQDEALSEFDRAIARGDEPDEACWCALYEWDLLDFAPDVRDETE
jgi:hypothetical protein